MSIILYEELNDGFIFRLIKHLTASDWATYFRRTVGRSSLYLHRRAIQRSTVQFVIFMVCAGSRDSSKIQLLIPRYFFKYSIRDSRSVQTGTNLTRVWMLGKFLRAFDKFIHATQKNLSGCKTFLTSLELSNNSRSCAVYPECPSFRYPKLLLSKIINYPIDIRLASRENPDDSICKLPAQPAHPAIN